MAISPLMPADVSFCLSRGNRDRPVPRGNQAAPGLSRVLPFEPFSSHDRHRPGEEYSRHRERARLGWSQPASIHVWCAGVRCFGGLPPRQLDHFFSAGPLAVTVILWALFVGFLAIVTVSTPASNFAETSESGAFSRSGGSAGCDAIPVPPGLQQPIRGPQQPTGPGARQHERSKVP